MATYGSGDEVNDLSTFDVYDLTSMASAPFDFGTAGYAANALLNVVAQHQVQFFGSTNKNFSSYIDVEIAGATVSLDGTGNAFMRCHPANDTYGYITYNLKDLDPGTYWFKAVFGGTNEVDQLTKTWTHEIVPLPS